MNPQLNKKVKKYLDSYFRDTKANSPEHQEAVMLILKGALTDANFHSEAKELGKYFPKASKKYIGTPMEGVIEDKGVDIAKMAKWDGHDIIDAFAFYLSMSIGGSFGNRLMSLKESIQVNEKNEPNNKELWSRAIAAAKAKYDVYPSAYANAFASNWYKEKGGTWKTKSESVDEAATRTAMEIGGLTGVNKDAIQKFVDDNKLDIEKLYQFVKKGKLADRMKLVSAIAGKPNNPVQKKMVKQFGESVNESQLKEFKHKVGSETIQFKVSPYRTGISLIAASGNDLDKLQDAMGSEDEVKGEIRKSLEKKLRIPIEIDRDYEGAGFGFKIDLYSLAKMVK